jgi:hypothetical protein
MPSQHQPDLPTLFTTRALRMFACRMLSVILLLYLQALGLPSAIQLFRGCLPEGGRP